MRVLRAFRSYLLRIRFHSLSGPCPVPGSFALTTASADFCPQPPPSLAASLPEGGSGAEAGRSPQVMTQSSPTQPPHLPLESWS